MKRVSLIVAFPLLLAISVGGCGEDDEKNDVKGDPIGAPKVQPPVERNSPTGFSLYALQESGNDTPEKRVIFELQRYLNPTQADAVGALDRLEAIDGRMEELDQRVQGGTPRACLDDVENTDYKLASDLPDGSTFELQLSCQENLDGGDGSAQSAQLAFGLTEDDFYLFERTGKSTNAVVAVAEMDETGTEFWQITANESATYIHVHADDDFGMEMATGGSGVSVFECGLQMRSDDDYIYVEAYDAVSGDEGQECSDQVTLCLSAADLSVQDDTSACETAGVNEFTFSAISSSANKDDADAIILTPIEGMTDFIEESAAVESEE